MKPSFYWWFGLVVALAGLSACGNHPKPAPVEDRSWQRDTAHKKAQVQRSKGSHRASRIVVGPSYGANRPEFVLVRPDETLYAISFRYNLDLKQVARFNHLKPPYTIFPGQKLRLKPDGAVANRTSKAKTVKKTASSVRKPKAKKSAPPDVVVRSAKKKPSSPAKNNQQTPAKPIASRTDQQKKKLVLKNPSRWLWPANGHLISSFSATDPARKGIIIAGQPGHSVKATANGVVVYSGNALKAYGQLIIIKHSDTYLSAYGYNRRSLVKEGQAVRQGQKIAEMGTSPSGKTGLKFEIRKNGQPVDPLKFLPKR